jgi:thioesterase domain-containing protein
VTADTPLQEAGVDSLAATELASRLRALTSLAISPTAALEYPTARGLAGHLLEDVMKNEVVGAAPSPRNNFAATSVALGRASAIDKRLQRPIVFLLSFIRSGSSLLQLCLNAHNELYAGQELYLLMFDTMDERSAFVGGQDLEEGLLATVMELRGCVVADAESFISNLGIDCPVSRMYEVLQDLCLPRVLVDKTPANASHTMFLRRIREVFAAPRFLHLVRHPYAAIESGLQLTRDILGRLDQTWEIVEQEWVESNMTTHKFLQDVEPPAKLLLRYEELVRSPTSSTRRICDELLSIIWEEKMARPYDSTATESFQAARKFVTTDPKLLRRKTIDASLADKWREVLLPQPLQPLTNATAQLFGYELHPELEAELVWLSRAPVHTPPLVVVHDFTGLLWSFDRLAKALSAPCLGVRCSQRLIDGCMSMQQLAWRYVRLLPSSILGKRTPIRLLAYSLGCRVAYRMAVALCQMGEAVQLVLLDGPAGPEQNAPPRFGGMVDTIVERIHARVRELQLVQPAQEGGRAAQLSRAPLSDPSADGLSGQRGSDPLDGLVHMVASMGADTASVAAALLQLPDDEEALPPAACGDLAALHVAAEASGNRTNGTVEAVEKCLPGVKKATVAGGHFDVLQRSPEAIAEHATAFFAGKTAERPPSDEWL